MRLRNRNATLGPLVLCAFLLESCSGVHLGNDITSLYDYGVASVSAHRVTLDQAAAIPYASMGIRVGSGDQRLIVLATDTEGTLLWMSADRIAVATRDGRVVRTTGLGRDLANFTPFSTANRDKSSAETHWTADFPDINAYAVPIACKRNPAGEETIEILGKAIRTIRLVEACSAKSSTINWQYENLYWSSPESGFIWRSVQHVHPNLDPLTIEIFRRPS